MIHIVVAACGCREWLSPFGYQGGRCTKCGERATYVREVCCDESYQCPTTGEVECRKHSGFDVCCWNRNCPGRR